jgi:CheY-like chemotaxis protein
MMELDESNDIYGNLSQLLLACDRAKDLVGQILAFSRQTEQDKKPTRVLPIISETCRFLRASLPASIQIVQKFQTEEDLILADPTQFHQVLMNLCTNSGHAMRDKGGVLEISTAKEVLHSEDMFQYGGIVAGTYLRITVRDTGCGIPSQIVSRIFEPYFTTKEKGEGTGLGLAVVHGIVSDHGGSIKVYSEEGKGTAFHLLFPILEDRSQGVVRATVEEPRRGSETILVVDDEENIRQFVKKSLEHLGYVVVTAKSGREALSIFKEDKVKFDLVVTDKTMSQMSGFVFAQALLAERPDIPVLLCTGFVEKADYLRAAAAGIREIISKPMRGAQLAAAVRKTLDGRDNRPSH